MFCSSRVYLHQRDKIVEEVLSRIPVFNLESDEVERLEWKTDTFNYSLSKHILYGHINYGIDSPYRRCIEIHYSFDNVEKIKRKKDYDGGSIYIYQAHFPDANKKAFKYGIEKDGWFFQFEKRRERKECR